MVVTGIIVAKRMILSNESPKPTFELLIRVMVNSTLYRSLVAEIGALRVADVEYTIVA
jgi:hypothetical protein